MLATIKCSPGAGRSNVVPLTVTVEGTVVGACWCVAAAVEKAADEALTMAFPINRN